MALKAILTAEEFEALDEGVKELYEEKDGKHVLQVDGIDDHPSIAALRNGHQRSKQERDEAKRKLSNYEKRFSRFLEVDEEIDLTDVEEDNLILISKFVKGEITLTEPDDGDDKGNKKNDIDVEKIKEMARKPLQRDLEAMTAERDKFKTQLESTVIEQALTDALVSAKIMSVYMGPLKSHFSRSVKLVEGDDGNPAAIIEGEYGEQPIANFIKDWSQTDEGKAFIDASGNSGGGSNGGGGNRGNSGPKLKNPWSKDNWNVTEQMKLFREDAEKARRMAAEHGVRI